MHLNQVNITSTGALVWLCLEDSYRYQHLHLQVILIHTSQYIVQFLRRVTFNIVANFLKNIASNIVNFLTKTFNESLRVLKIKWSQIDQLDNYHTNKRYLNFG